MMNTESINQSLSRIAPIMIFLSLVLVVGGVTILLYFGYTIYELLVEPEKSVFLNYIITQMPVPNQDVFTFKGMFDNRNFELSMPTSLIIYGRYVLAFMIWAMVGGLVTSLLSGGINIFKVLTNLNLYKNVNQKDLNDADTRNSNNPR